VSEREFQIERAGTWDKGKGCDTFGPTGPWLVTLDEVGDFNALGLWLAVDGKRYTVNALISRFRAFMQPFCGPASKNLAAYGRWHAARNNADRSYLDALRLLLAAGPRANTIC